VLDYGFWHHVVWQTDMNISEELIVYCKCWGSNILRNVINKLPVKHSTVSQRSLILISNVKSWSHTLPLSLLKNKLNHQGAIWFKNNFSSCLLP